MESMSNEVIVTHILKALPDVSAIIDLEVRVLYLNALIVILISPSWC